jgi:DNA-binding XRE family transcriptional regulator
MPELTKKRRTDKEMVTVSVRVHRNNVAKIKEYARLIEEGPERNYSVAEVFPEYMGKERQIALRAYRNREDLTQRQLAEQTGIPQRHLSEMENGKRTIGKEMAKRLSEVLKCDYRFLL